MTAVTKGVVLGPAPDGPVVVELADVGGDDSCRNRDPNHRNGSWARPPDSRRTLRTWPRCCCVDAVAGRRDNVAAVAAAVAND